MSPPTAAPEAPAADPLAGLTIRHDSEVRVIDGAASGDMPHTVVLDGEDIGGYSTLADADHLAKTIEGAIEIERVIYAAPVRPDSTVIEHQTDPDSYEILLDPDTAGEWTAGEWTGRIAHDIQVGIEERIRHAQLVRDTRALADWIDQHPTEIAALGDVQITAHFGFFAAGKLDKLTRLAELLDEYTAETEDDGTVRLAKSIGDRVRITGYAHAVAQMPQPAPAPKLPDLPGRNLTAEPETPAS